MPANFSTGVPSLDPSTLKEALKEFLQGQSEFTSHNFDGSALSTILDLLTKNTHYMAFIANMMSKESFLRRAELRKNVVEHAQRLSYVPTSRTCAKAEVDIVVTPDEGTSEYPTFITLAPNTLFSGQYASEVINFANQDEYVLYLDTTNNTYSRSGVGVYQGDLIQESFTYSSDNPSEFVLSNPNIDISTLRVSVQNSASDTRSSPYSRVEDIVEIGPTSTVYFIYENSDGKYRIEFGDNILGKELTDGNIINVEYMAVNSDTVANSVTSLSLVNDIDGFVDAEVTVSTPSYGGSDREDKDQIRRWAPLGWEAQERSVTAADYTVNLKKVFPQAKSAVAWGGEENDPPRFGSMFVAINTKDGSVLVSSIKEQIVKLLRKYNVGPITPIIVDPEYVDMDLDISVGYDAIDSQTSMNDEFKAIASLCDTFSNNKLEDFERHFISSDLTSLIKNREAVVSADLDIIVSKSVEVLIGSEIKYTVRFNNSIEAGSIEAKGFKIYPTDSDTRLYDDGKGTLKIDRLVNGARKVIDEDAGTVDYDEGTVEFTFLPISVEAVNNKIKLYAEPSESNYLAVRQDILRLATINVNENTKLRRG